MAATSETQLFQGQLLDALAPCSGNSFQAPRQVVWHLNDQVRHLRPLPLLIVPHTKEEAKPTSGSNPGLALLTIGVYNRQMFL